MRRDPLAYLTTELTSLKAQGLYRPLRILEDEQKPTTTFDHRQVVNLSSNNYLGLTTHPRLRERALEATRRFGVGTGSVRTIAGTMAIHMELERRLAEFKNTEAVVVFQSGFAANAGTVSAILGKDDIVVSDELNHASIIDGCRLSRATIKVFPHKDVDAARKVLQALPGAAPGHAVPHAPHHRRRVQHGRRPRPAGRFVRAGRGVRLHHDGGRRARQRRVRPQRPRDDRSLRRARPRGHSGRARCRKPSAFWAATSPARARSSTSCTTARARFCSPPPIRRRSRPRASPRSTCCSRSRRSSSGCGTTPASSRPASARLGFNTGLSESPITPVIVGDGALAMKLSDRLFEAGVFAQGIAAPDRAARQGPRAHDRHRHAHARRAAVCARRVRRRSAANWESCREETRPASRLDGRPMFAI